MILVTSVSLEARAPGSTSSLGTQSARLVLTRLMGQLEATHLAHGSVLWLLSRGLFGKMMEGWWARAERFTSRLGGGREVRLVVGRELGCFREQ